MIRRLWQCVSLSPAKNREDENHAHGIVSNRTDNSDLTLHGVRCDAP